jgi:crossover junction endodeoxyribonuclease RuvC
MRIILGLDLSSVASGWSLFHDDKLAAMGVISPDSDLSETGKIFFITHSVYGLFKIYKPTELVIEDTFYSKDPTVLKKLNRIAGAIQYTWFNLRATDPSFYMAISARKSIPNLKGNSDKEEIVKLVNQHFNLRGRLKDHNIADAIVVAYHHVVHDNMEKLKAPLDYKMAKVEDMKVEGKQRVRSQRFIGRA